MASAAGADITEADNKCFAETCTKKSISVNNFNKGNGKKIFCLICYFSKIWHKMKKKIYHTVGTVPKSNRKKSQKQRQKRYTEHTNMTAYFSGICTILL